MNRFLFATILGAVCAALATAADPALRPDIGSSPTLEQAGDLPPGVYLTGDEEPITESAEDAEQKAKRTFGTRLRFCFRQPSGQTTCGWRYPLSYWSTIGRFRHANECEFDQSFGEFYYC